MKNEADFVYIIFYILVFLVLILVVIVLFITKSRKKLFEKEIERKDLEIKLQKEVLQATILTQEKERERIAQDLHDEISSKLIAISLNLQLLYSKKTKEESKNEIIENLIKINQNTIENSRKIAHDLLPPVLEKFGLHAAFEELALDYNNSKSVAIIYENHVEFDTLGSEKSLQIFRIFQELINNSIRHGKASQIEMRFNKNDTKFHFQYHDNGIGFNEKDLNKIKAGMGMRNIESRVEYLNGTFSIHSRNHEGIQFELRF